MRADWAVDDLILGTLLGAWLGERVVVGKHPLNGGIVAATVVVFAYCVRATLAGDRRSRVAYILPATLALGLLWAEAEIGLLDGVSMQQIGVIVAVWIAALAIRAWGRRMP